MQYVIWLLFGILTLATFIGAVLGRKNVPVFNTVLIIFIFFGTCVALFLSASAMYTQQQWRTTNNKWIKNLEEAETEHELLVVGDPSKVTSEDDVDCLNGVRAALDRVMINRGRVWRNCQKIGGNEGTYQIAVNIREKDSPAAVALKGLTGAAASERKAAIENDLVDLPLHAFQERVMAFNENILPIEGEDREILKLRSMPRTYLGEFIVTAASADLKNNSLAITLKPRITLPEAQKTALAKSTPDISWALYETMPIDSYEAFAGLDLADLQIIFPKGGLDDAAYSKMISRYDASGKPVDPATVSPENVWKSITITKPIEKNNAIRVDAASERAGFPTRSPMIDFNAQGLAIAGPLLEAELPADYQVGQPMADPTNFEGQKLLRLLPTTEATKVLFPGALVDKWVAAGLCKEEGIYYLRPLTNYVAEFQHYEHVMKLLAAAQQQVETNILIVNNASAKATNIKVGKEDVKSKLLADLAGYQKELKLITELQAELKAHYNETRSEMVRLFNENNAMAAQIAKIEKQIAERINASLNVADNTQ